MPRRRTPQKGQGVVGTPRSQPTTAGSGLGRGSPQGANNRKPQLATPGSQVKLQSLPLE